MKKLIKLVVVLFVLAIVAVLVLSFYGKSLIKSGIEVGATAALKTDVTLEGVDFSLTGGSAGVQGLSVANLPEYKEKDLLTLGNVSVDVGLKSLMSETVHIQHILVDGMRVTLEQNGLKNNVAELVKSLSSGKADTPDKPDEPAPESDGPSKDLVIDKLAIRNVEVKVAAFPGFGGTTLKLKPIEMENLGTNEKMDMAALASKVLKAVIEGVAGQGGGVIPADLMKGLDSLKSIKSLEGATKAISNLSGEDGAALKEGLKDVSKGLNNIFNKKE